MSNVFNEPVLEREANGGIQKIYRFDNGYGASVVQHNFSYGNELGLWELAVIEFTGDEPDEFSLAYDTPVTDDVLGRLTEAQVEKVLKQIKALASPPEHQERKNNDN